MKKSILNTFKNLLFLSAGILILWLITKDQPYEKIYAELKKTNYFWIGISLIPGLFSHWFRALRWNLMIESLHYKTRTATTFYAVMIGYFANLAVPRVGEITRCGVLSKKGKIPMNSLIGTVVLERSVDLVMLLLIIAGVIVFQLDLVGNWLGDHMRMPFSETASSGWSQILMLLGGLLGFIFLSVMAFRIVIQKIKEYAFFYKIKRFYIGFVNGIKSIARLRSKWLFLAYTGLIWLMYTTMVYLPFFAMQETQSLNFIDAVSIMAIGSLGIVAPVPGGIGTYHAIVIGTLTGIYHISESVSTTFAYLVHAAQTVMIIIAGSLSYALLFFQPKGKTL